MNHYKAFIEIPKGDTRRRHKSYRDGTLIDFGPIKDKIPINDGVMPVHYGYIIGTLNKDESPPEELDIIVFSERDVGIGEILEIKPIGLMQREDHDHKIISIEISNTEIQTWEDIKENEKQLIKVKNIKNKNPPFLTSK